MKKLIFYSLATITFLSSQSWANFLALNETAELLPENYFKLGLAPQLRLSDGGGFNIGAFFDSYLTEDTNFRVTIGGGKVDFFTSASLKWVPFPDVGRQPALGLRGALIYSRDEAVGFTSVQFAPIVSKLAETTLGKMVPYIGLPVTYVSSKDESFTGIQFAVGAEWFNNKDFHSGVEFDLNLSKSFTAVSVFVGFPFDQGIGYKK